MAGEGDIELDRSRSGTEILRATFRLYGRYPLLFPVLAAVMVVPYLLVVLLVTGDGPLELKTNLPFIARELLGLSDVILVWPLVSALHVHAVMDVTAGNRPRLADVARRGLRALPLVTVVVAVSWIAITLGLLALVAPGLFLLARWSVAAQTATLEGGSWIDALRRSANLARDHHWHILAVLLMVGIVTGVPGFLIALPFRHSDPSVGSFLLGAVVEALTSSFGALATAILYLDLKARMREKEAAPPLPTAGRPAASSRFKVEPSGDPIDPDSWSDDDRPPGWYVNPQNSKRMRFWAADGTQSWSEREAKTPGVVREEFLKRRGSKSRIGSGEESHG
jgi:hypothetical protein